MRQIIDASTFAAASTGTAIATLSGAAATNATLAFFGGGSLAAGGLGMAGGTAVLGGLVAGPALCVIDYSAAWNAPIRNKENGNPNQGTHQSETRNASIRTRNALAVEIISCP